MSENNIRRLSIVAAAAVVLIGCGARSETGGAGEELPRIVVTTSVLGDVVARLVGDDAVVQVLIPNGQDPHDYAASARDVEALHEADLVVANGLGLEEGLVDAIDAAAEDGVAVFTATDHVTVRPVDEPDGGHAEGDEHDHAGGDPHVWTDPNVMAEMAPDLVAALAAVTGNPLDEERDAFIEDMAALDAEVRDLLSGIPAGECRLVTGHESLGYFADRYGCEVLGSVIPGLSSTAEPSAGDLAELIHAADAAGVRAIFTELGTSSQVAQQVAEGLGVPLVELPSHGMPEGGGYDELIVELATRITGGLTST